MANQCTLRLLIEPSFHGTTFALTRLMQSMVFGVSTSDPLTYAAVAGLLILVGLFAAYVPARRATRIDPVIALRAE